MCAAYKTSDARAPKDSRRRLALVIGNGRYESGSNLRNPENDANDMANCLKSIGFDVTKGVNLTCDMMESHVNNFAWKVQPNDMVVFHYAGHGTQWEDQNYLLPSDDKGLTGTNIRRRALNAQEVLKKITDRHPFVSVFFLDCCRNYHLRHEGLRAGNGQEPRGLAKMSTAGGSLIAFACDAGKTAADGTGRNGLFTKHLLLNIVKPNEEIQDLIIDVANGVEQESHGTQQPWNNSSLRHRHIFLAQKDGDSDSDELPNKHQSVPSYQPKTDQPYKPKTEQLNQLKSDEPCHQQMLQSHQMQYSPSGFNNKTTHTYQSVSYGYKSGSGPWHHEFHETRNDDSDKEFHNDSSFDSFIRRAERMTGRDINGDGKIG